MTLCYPQLSTGALVQYPASRTTYRRTIINWLPDGSSIRLSDPDAGSVEWELEYDGLTDGERESLQEFFGLTEGCLKTFLFLDPFGNLLSWSEDPGKPVWNCDPLLRFEQDERSIRLTNTGQTNQALSQSIELPATLCYCFSLLAKSSSPATITLSVSSGSVQSQTELATTERWQRFACFATAGTGNSNILCSVQVRAGESVDVQEMQLQAQPSPSSYKRTTDTPGIFPETRFELSKLQFRANGIDNHSTLVRLISRAGA